MELAIPLDESSKEPLYQQVVKGVRKLIADSQLKPGSRMPSTRELAETLGLSRFTTSKAYDELARQGYIETLHSVGTFVCRRIPSVKVDDNGQDVDYDSMPLDADELRLSTYGRRMITSPHIEASDLELHSELNYGAPAPEQLPLTKWRRMIVRSCQDKELSSRSYMSPVFGHVELRKALADYLLRTRGVNCSHEQICLFSGAQPAVDLLSRLTLNATDHVAVENPGFPGARRVFYTYGATVMPVKVDDHGIDVWRLTQESQVPKLVYLTPSHQDPTGVMLSEDRRKQLLAWAGQNNVWLMEDDFDCEYRYGEKPISSLQSQDDSGNVIYISSFWKIMFPVLRLGFVVLPHRLVPVVRRAKGLVERDFQFVEHEALAAFIREGHLERHIRRTRRIYAKRREILIEKLIQHIGAKIRISPVSAGTNLLARFDEQIAEETILKCASESDLPLVSTYHAYVEGAPRNEFLIPFAHVDEVHITSGVENFSKALV